MSAIMIREDAAFAAYRGCGLRRRRPQVPVMEPADARQAQYTAGRKRPFFDHADSWRFFIQPDVRAVLVVVADVLLAESNEMDLVPRDHVIQHLPAYTLDPSFGDAVGEGGQLHGMVTLPILPLKSSILIIL
jgi:hypothetical protein